MDQNTVTPGYAHMTTGEAVTKDEGGLERLDHELQYLEEEIKRLEMRIGPILNQYLDQEKLSQPQPEPSSQFRGRLERLADLRVALGTIIDRVDL